MELLEIGYFNTKLLQLSTSSSLNIHSSIFQCPNTIQTVIAHINSKLNLPAGRSEGLRVLKTILPQCTDEVFFDNGLSWMQQCLKAGDGQNQTETTTLAYQVLKMLLQTSRQLPEMTKQITNVVVPKFSGQVQHLPKESILAALQCTEVVLSSYGGACSPSKAGLEKMLVQFADQPGNPQLVDVAARCVALLPLVGGGGTQGVHHRNRWSEAQLGLCNTLHHLLDQLFENVDEIQSHSSAGGQMLQIPLITDTNAVAKTLKLSTRLCNVAKFLQAMLVGVFPVAKCVVPDTILSIVSRGLAVTCHTLGRKSTADMLVLGSNLPHIHTALLATLDALIACCGRNLLPHGPVICKLVLQSLKWTSTDKWTYGAERPYQALRVAACSTLVTWLTVAKAASCVELTAEQLVVLLAQDVRVLRPAVTLATQGRRSKLLSKKHQRKQQQGEGVEGQSSKKKEIKLRGMRNKLLDPAANGAVCEAALGALECLLQSAASSMKPTLHKLLQEMAVMLLMDLQRCSRPTDTLVPFSVPKCRLGLYRLLYALTMEPHPTWPPPTQHALQLLAAGQRDPSTLVSGYCTMALSGLEKLLHPGRPTMHFPLILGELDQAVAVAVNHREPVYLSGGHQLPEANHKGGDEEAMETMGQILLEDMLELPGDDTSPRVQALPGTSNQLQTDVDAGHEILIDSDSGHQEVVINSGLGDIVVSDSDDTLASDSISGDRILLDFDSDSDSDSDSGDQVVFDSDSGDKVVFDSDFSPEVVDLEQDAVIHWDSNPEVEILHHSSDEVQIIPDSGRKPHSDSGLSNTVHQSETFPDSSPGAGTCSETGPEIEAISQGLEPSLDSESQEERCPESDDVVVELLEEPSAKRIKLSPGKAALANGDLAPLVNGDTSRASPEELDEEEMLKAFDDVLKD